MGYNIRTRMVEDPLGGIEDLKKGIIEPADSEVPLGKDFFRIMSIFKTSAKAGLKISERFRKFLLETRKYIKEYLLIYKDRTCHKFRKITDDLNSEFSIRAFNLLVDYNMMDVFIPIEFLPDFAYNQTRYKHKIFNMALVSEYIIKHAEHTVFKITEKQKHYIYNDIFRLAFEKENELWFSYDNFNNTKFVLNMKAHKTILTSAKRYCEYVDCMISKLKKIDVNLLNDIINDILSKIRHN